jgi:hypothetical protein
MIVLLVFCLSGALAGVVGYLAVRALQFRLFGVNLMYASAFAGFGAPFLGLALLGARVARTIVRRRTGEAIARLGKHYDVDTAVLHETARAVDAL